MFLEGSHHSNVKFIQNLGVIWMVFFLRSFDNSVQFLGGFGTLGSIESFLGVFSVNFENSTVLFPVIP